MTEAIAPRRKYPPFSAGHRFGRLTTLEDQGPSKVKVQCRCDCGKLTAVLPPFLHRGSTKSCGCFKRDASWTPSVNLKSVVPERVKIGYPACWEWEVTEQDLALAATADADNVRYVLETWQPGCGVCGRQMRSCLDHDHETWLVRGFLCRSCNFFESRVGHHRIFAMYRAANPASMLGIEVMYGSRFMPTSVEGVARMVRREFSAEDVARLRDLLAG